MKIFETRDFLKSAYDKGGFFCTSSTIYQVNFNSGSGQYSFFPVFKKFKSALNFSKRGHCNFLDAETAERWSLEYSKNGQGVYC